MPLSFGFFSLCDRLWVLRRIRLFFAQLIDFLRLLSLFFPSFALSVSEGTLKRDLVATATKLWSVDLQGGRCFGLSCAAAVCN